MFTCQHCRRAYKTRSSLTRHAHNHSTAPEHVCEECGVSFARSDLLTRHRQNGHGQQDQARDEERRSTRQRCHTACEPCRRTRARCDGNAPCHSCQAADRHCHYADNGRRVSKVLRRRRHAQSPSLPHADVNVGDDLYGQAHGQGDEAAPLSPPIDVSAHVHTQAQSGPLSPPETRPVDARLSPPSSEEHPHGLPDTPANHADGIPSPRIVEPGLDPTDQDLLADTGILNFAPGPGDVSGGATIDLDGMSWPWFHETLFLQDEPTLGRAHGVDQAWPSLQSRSLPASSAREPHRDGQVSVEHDAHQPATCDVPGFLNREVDSLTQHAAQLALNPEHRPDSTACWRSAGTRLRPVLGTFGSSPTAEESSHQIDNPSDLLNSAILVHFLPKFDRLWPIYGGTVDDLNALHPILYLVMLSIGCMYGSDTQRQFGSLLHKSVRRLLTASLFDLEAHEGDMTWLAHARLLTQVQGLYFGQKQSFSYAQVGILIAAVMTYLLTFRSI